MKSEWILIYNIIRNMKIYLLFFIIIFGTFSCQNNEIKNKITYQSSDNEISNIKLIIDKNHTFLINMEILPDLEGENEKSTFEKYKGTWNKKGDFLQLEFKTKRVNVKQLFDPRENEKENVKLINSNTIAIREDIAELIIWGILCERE